MNTPVHATLALAVLGKKEKPKELKWIFLGAVLPDLSMFGLFFYEVMIGTPQRIIWNEKYYTPLWQNTTDLFNSFPLFLALYLLALYQRWRAVQVVCLAAFLHLATDLPLHHDDGHRHFYPLSDWRYESPISYWDPNHYGDYWMIVEMVLLLVTAYLSYRVITNKGWRGVLLGACLLTLALPLVFFLTLA